MASANFHGREGDFSRVACWSQSKLHSSSLPKEHWGLFWSDREAGSWLFARAWAGCSCLIVAFILGVGFKHYALIAQQWHAVDQRFFCKCLSRNESLLLSVHFSKEKSSLETLCWLDMFMVGHENQRADRAVLHRQWAWRLTFLTLLSRSLGGWASEWLNHCVHETNHWPSSEVLSLRQLPGLLG